MNNWAETREPLDADQVCNAVRGACLSELAAMKPGNVSVYSDGHGMVVEDFERSAHAIAPLLALPGLCVGERILCAIDATRRVVGCNTNLGIVMLCAPIAHAALRMQPGQPLRAALADTLQNLDERDTELAYRAIRLAKPGGMGVVPEHDISVAKPRAGLLQVMSSSASRDRIAYQYANAYVDVFEIAEPRLRAGLKRWRSEQWAVVSTYLELLTTVGDSLVERKHGVCVARRLCLDAGHLGALLDEQSNPAHMLNRLTLFDRTLKQKGINPGTTADLVVAALMVKRLHDHMRATGLVPAPGGRPVQVAVPARFINSNLSKENSYGEDR